MKKALTNHTLKSLLSHEYIHGENIGWAEIMPIAELIETTTWAVSDKYRRGYFKREAIDSANIEIVTLFDPRSEFKGWSFLIAFVLGPNIVDNGLRYASKMEATKAAVIYFSQLYNNEFNSYEKNTN